MCRILAAIALVTFLLPSDLPAQQKKTRDQKVREDQQKVLGEGFWIYNDLPAAFEKARLSGKPILVVLRCIPCEDCVKLDDDLVDTDPVLKPLLEKFVCVRVVSTNGLDLSLFQYDTDQSFAAFMLNADRTIYGRFGTRSHHSEWVGDVSLKGLAEALQGALELHADYPANKSSLVGKTGPRPLYDRPELFPALKDKYTSSLNYSGDVVKSCIHCHQIGDAARDYYRSRSEPLPEELLSPYPHPRSIGLILDPTTRGTVKSVSEQSLAAASGFQSGDQIQKISGQPILAMADVQWVLHHTPAEGAALKVSIVREGKSQEVILNLPDGWRRLDDISWRVSAWGMRRMVTGGLVFEPLPDDEREKHDLSGEKMALRIKHVGQYGAHAAGKNAGFQQGDIVVSYDDRQDLLTDSDLLRYAVNARKPGDKVNVKIIRGAKQQTLQLPMQN